MPTNVDSRHFQGSSKTSCKKAVYEGLLILRVKRRDLSFGDEDDGIIPSVVTLQKKTSKGVCLVSCREKKQKSLKSSCAEKKVFLLLSQTFCVCQTSDSWQKRHTRWVIRKAWWSCEYFRCFCNLSLLRKNSGAAVGGCKV